jgi:DNA-binding CsgD family transcriptional regulator
MDNSAATGRRRVAAGGRSRQNHVMPPASPALSPAERQVLALLGAGHTAKSIAAELGISVHAVNERLREARRKTGAGSSRELARALAAQENRDKEIGVERMPVETAATGRPGTAWRGRRPRPKELAAMTVALLAIVALFAWSQEAVETADPYAALARSAGGTSDLYARVRAEPLAEPEASEVQRRLEAPYAQLPGVGPVEVRCARTLCEVAAEVVAGEAERAVRTVQGADFARRVRDAGFQAPVTFAVGNDKGTHRMLVYWTRAG